MDRFRRAIREDGQARYGRHAEVDMEVADARRMLGLAVGEEGEGDEGDEESAGGIAGESPEDEGSFAATDEEEGAQEEQG